MLTYHNQPMTWKEASVVCRRYGGHLVYDKNGTHVDEIKTYMADYRKESLWNGRFSCPNYVYKGNGSPIFTLQKVTPISMCTASITDIPCICECMQSIL